MQKNLNVQSLKTFGWINHELFQDFYIPYHDYIKPRKRFYVEVN